VRCPVCEYEVAGVFYFGPGGIEDFEDHVATHRPRWWVRALLWLME
jgi:hypothetical protein